MTAASTPYEGLPLVALLCYSARMLYTATVVGNPCPFVAKLYQELQSPQPGDLVVETSAMHRADRDRTWDESIGRLILVRGEFVPFNEEEGGYTETYTYIEGFDGRLHRWHNCCFIKVLERWRREDDEQGASERKQRWVAEAVTRHQL